MVLPSAYLHVCLTAVDVEWLGVHHSDLFDDLGTCKVAPEALQNWAPSDNKVFTGLKLLMDASEKVSACTTTYFVCTSSCVIVHLTLFSDGVDIRIS